MKKQSINLLAPSACLLLLAFAANAQDKKAADKNDTDSAAVTVAKNTGNAAVIVVGTAAKVAYKTTKFVVKDVAAPVAVTLVKPVVTKAAPAVAKFALKKSIKYLLPVVIKLSVL